MNSFHVPERFKAALTALKISYFTRSEAWSFSTLVLPFPSAYVNPYLSLKQFCGNLVTLVIALGRDYLTVIPDAVIDQVAVRIVRVMVSYQNKLSDFLSPSTPCIPELF